MKLLYPLKTNNDFAFNSSSRDFIVTEIPLYEFSGEGEHLVLKVRKKELTTWEMILRLAKHLGIDKREIGYAGLKDKHAMTVQYISILAKNEEKLSSFDDEYIKILDTTRHNNKIRTGHLKGNRFDVRLKKVLGVSRDKLDSSLEWIAQNGVPNYFGSQRFGIEGDNYLKGKAIIDKKLKMKDRKMRDFLISAYQSHLFNAWLSKRVEISLLAGEFEQKECEGILGVAEGTFEGIKGQKNFFKLLKGDQMMHYPHGKLFEVEDIAKESARFSTRDISPTGLLSGKRATHAASSAFVFEEPFVEPIDADGSRRYAWIWVEDIKKKYIAEKAHYELSFTLPKGCYATNVLDVLRGC